MKLIHIKDISPYFCFFLIVFLFALLLSVDNVQAAVGAGGADVGAERTQCGRRVAAAAEAAERGHAGVVPAVDDAVGDQLGQPALGRHGVRQLEACELDLLGLVGR